MHAKQDATTPFDVVLAEVHRAREQTEEYTQQYAQRAGIEGTISQGVHISGLRRARYRGLTKTRLQYILTACALNIVRVMRWLAGEPLARTRQSAFAKLYASATWIGAVVRQQYRICGRTTVGVLPLLGPHAYLSPFEDSNCSYRRSGSSTYLERQTNKAKTSPTDEVMQIDHVLVVRKAHLTTNAMNVLIRSVDHAR